MCKARGGRRWQGYVTLVQWREIKRCIYKDFSSHLRRWVVEIPAGPLLDCFTLIIPSWMYTPTGFNIAFVLLMTRADSGSTKDRHITKEVDLVKKNKKTIVARPGWVVLDKPMVWHSDSWRCGAEENENNRVAVLRSNPKESHCDAKLNGLSQYVCGGGWS